MRTVRPSEATQRCVRRHGIALVAVVATSLLAAAPATTSPGKGAGSRSDVNQGDPDKVLTVASGFACSGDPTPGAKVEGGGLGRTVSFATARPIAHVTLKSGADASVVSSSFAPDYLSGTVTLSKDVSNYVVWTCSAPPAPAKATLTVIKRVINDNGGTKTPADFTLQVSGGNPSPSSFAGSAVGTTVQLDAGSYSVTEPAVSGYTAGYSAGCTGTVAAGGTATCTVTNDDNPPTAATTPPATPASPTASASPANASAPATRAKPAARRAARCAQLVVGRRSLVVGRRVMLVARVRLQGGSVRGLRITVRGAGVRAAGRANFAGIARIAVRPTRAGIIVVRIAGQPARCGARRIGVVGTYRPPSLTG